VFRSPFYSPNIEEPIEVSLGALNGFLAKGHFLLAAHLTAILLTSPSMRPSDSKTIFTLLYTRLACLELTGNTALAAQESKALEDLHSTFYYVDTDLEVAGDAAPQVQKKNSYHIVPWPLRVLAVRLQSIGFGDPRRGITGLYELGFEARQEIMRPGLDKSKRQIWQERLLDLGVRSVNALVEMSDLDAAQRSLNSLGFGDSDSIKLRAALLALRIGDVTAAKEILSKSDALQEGILKPLTSMADGRYDDAISEWRALLENPIKSNEPMIVQNLAVCLLYTGQLNEVSVVFTEKKNRCLLF
jgi:tetratricopeptide (TPR) repeat protein